MSAAVRGAFQNIRESDDVKRHVVVLSNHVDPLFVQLGKPPVLKETFDRNCQYTGWLGVTRAEKISATGIDRARVFHLLYLLALERPRLFKKGTFLKRFWRIRGRETSVRRVMRECYEFGDREPQNAKVFGFEHS